MSSSKDKRATRELRHFRYFLRCDPTVWKKYGEFNPSSPPPTITVELVAVTNIQKIVRGYLIRRFAYMLKMGGPGSFIIDNCRMLWKDKGPTMFWYKELCKCRKRLEKSREEYMLLEKLYNEQKLTKI